MVLHSHVLAFEITRFCTEPFKKRCGLALGRTGRHTADKADYRQRRLLRARRERPRGHRAAEQGEELAPVIRSPCRRATRALLGVHGLNCVVIIVHHCGIVGSRPRGHTSLTGACDGQIAVERDDNGTISIKVEFMKDDEAGAIPTVKRRPDLPASAFAFVLILSAPGRRSAAHVAPCEHTRLSTSKTPHGTKNPHGEGHGPEC